MANQPPPPPIAAHEVRLRLLVGLTQLAMGGALVIALLSGAPVTTLLILAGASFLVVGTSQLRWKGRRWR